MAAFLSQISLLSEKPNGRDTFLNIVSNFLPIFYAFILFLAIDIFMDLDRNKTKRDKNYEGYDVEENCLNTQEIYASDGLMEDNIKKSEGLNIEHFGLTKRELAVARELLTDSSNKEIGEILFISESTVKKHVQNIFKKVDAKNRTEFIHKFSMHDHNVLK